jgi:hypothetical protein
MDGGKMREESSPISAPKVPSRNRRQVSQALAFFVAALAPLAALAGIELDGSLKNVSPGLIKALQRRLTELGFSPGPVNGKWSRRTEAAFAEFSRQRELPPVDRLTRDHILALWDEDIDSMNHREILDFLHRIKVGL